MSTVAALDSAPVLAAAVVAAPAAAVVGVAEAAVVAAPAAAVVGLAEAAVVAVPAAAVVGLAEATVVTAAVLDEDVLELLHDTPRVVKIPRARKAVSAG